MSEAKSWRVVPLEQVVAVSRSSIRCSPSPNRATQLATHSSRFEMRDADRVVHQDISYHRTGSCRKGKVVLFPLSRLWNLGIALNELDVAWDFTSTPSVGKGTRYIWKSCAATSIHGRPLPQMTRGGGKSKRSHRQPPKSGHPQIASDLSLTTVQAPGGPSAYIHIVF